MILSKKIALLCSFMMIYPLFLSAKPGCKDSSEHLSHWYDSKIAHYVKCTCPCEPKNQAVQGTFCLICQHIHDPQTQTIIPTVLADKKRYTGHLANYPTSQEVLAALLLKKNERTNYLK